MSKRDDRDRNKARPERKAARSQPASKPGEPPQAAKPGETPSKAADRPRKGAAQPSPIEELRPSPPPEGSGTAPLGDEDVFLFHEGTLTQAWRQLGAHVIEASGEQRVRFAVWAPNAARVSVTGSFNGWSRDAHALEPLGTSGLWQGTFADVAPGDLYKYHIVSHSGYEVDKRDPFGFYGEDPPRTASIVCDLAHRWRDEAWMRARASRNALDAPISIYEVHLGSWRYLGLDDSRPSYRALAEPLAEYAKRMGFTHVELLPIAEHPFYGSWGYQSTGFFSPTARYGSPQDLMHLIDTLHANDLGVILDWVPSHFPTDEHGLTYFDGTHLFEHPDPRRGFHPDWNSSIFDYGRPEVRSFLISNALFWLSVYHFDGLRVDAVASMLYLDFGRQHGQWLPNDSGGRENLEAVDFLRRVNDAAHALHPDVLMIAEESSTWPGVTRPTAEGGLGFDLKWDMGWMNDTLRYIGRDPIHRRWHHDELTFRSMYAFSERFVLPLSHDEVVYEKGALSEKPPGDAWQRFANVRVLFAYMWAQPGKKLLFMGGEFGQSREWNHDAELDWELGDPTRTGGLQRLVGDLNRLYREQPALHRLDCDPAGFQWIEADDSERSVYVFLRRDETGKALLVALNFTPIPRHGYRVGVPTGGTWTEILNSDDPIYGGSGQGNLGAVEAAPVRWHEQPFSLNLVVPPLGAVFFTQGP